MLANIVKILEQGDICIIERVMPQPADGFPQAFVEFHDYYKVGGRWIARYVVNVWCESHNADQFAEQARQVLDMLLAERIVVDSSRRLAVEDMLRKSQRLGMIQFIVKASG